MNELRALRSPVNALRREMVRELALVRVRRMADDCCHRWFVNRSNHELLPDPHPFIRRMGQAGLRPPSFAAGYNFLDGCHRSNTNPEPQRLIRILLPWSRNYSAAF